LRSTVRIPENVVFRSFVKETVILNLTTGKYHGLNPTAGHMLEVLEQRDSVGDAAAQLAEEYGQPREEIERDLCSFCADLAERGLIEIDDGGAG